MAEQILVVDDEPEVGQLFGYSLVRNGYEVAVARNGPDALELIHRRTPDLIILDLMMPEMDGYEVLRRVRKNPDTKLVPVVILTGRTETKDRIVAFESGADQYVSKPVTMVEMLAIVRCLLQRTRSWVYNGHELGSQAVPGIGGGNGDGPRQSVTIIDKPLRVLTAEHIRKIDDALAKSGPFAEVKLIKAKGKLRFIQRTESESLIDSRP